MHNLCSNCWARVDSVNDTAILLDEMAAITADLNNKFEPAAPSVPQHTK
jgi:hypothetical protein